MIYPIHLYGHPILSLVAQDYPDFPDTKEEIIKVQIPDMFETMYNAGGAGLARPQVGYSFRLIVIDVEISDGVKFKQAFINPHILSTFGDNYIMTEGCLSLPGIEAKVIRPEKVDLEWLDENFKKQRTIFTGLQSRVIQHEMDHLDGKLFIDRIDLDTKQRLLLPLLNIKQRKINVKYPII